MYDDLVSLVRCPIIADYFRYVKMILSLVGGGVCYWVWWTPAADFSSKILFIYVLYMTLSHSKVHSNVQ